MSDSTLLTEDGWSLERTSLVGGYVWACHDSCEKSISSRYGNWFPRDNAIIGECCYCGAKVPESFVVLYKLYNWDQLKEFEPVAWGMKDGSYFRRYFRR